MAEFGRSGYVTALLTIAAVLIAVQITLGALTVWLRLAPWTVTAHLITGNLFASTTFLLALAFRAKKRIREYTILPFNRRRLWITVIGGLLLIQLGLGGLVSSRYAGLACPEWPTCNGGVWFPTWVGGVGLHLFHRMTAYALIVCLGVAAFSCRRDGRLRGATALAFALGILQGTIGVASVSNGIPVELTGLHTALAAALVLTVVFALQEAWSTLGEREFSRQRTEARHRPGCRAFERDATKAANTIGVKMRSYQIFAAMPPDRAAAVMSGLSENAPQMFKQALFAASASMNARPTYLQRQPFEKQVAAVRRALSRVAAEWRRRRDPGRLFPRVPQGAAGRVARSARNQTRGWNPRGGFTCRPGKGRAPESA